MNACICLLLSHSCKYVLLLRVIKGPSMKLIVRRVRDSINAILRRYDST